MTRLKLLTKTKQKINKKKFYGFDCETYGDKNEFYLGTIYGDDTQKVFYDKEEMIKEFTNRKYDNTIFVATNLAFDINVLFTKEDYGNFLTCSRGSDLLSIKTYVKDNKFQLETKKHLRTFIDTMNYNKSSVEKMGKLLNLPKLTKPKCLGKIPNNEQERIELETYCLRDSEISQKFMVFFQDVIHQLGGDFKLTIASTSMKLFRNKYLKGQYFINNQKDLEFQFLSYFGGRTEAFVRGRIAKRLNKHGQWVKPKYYDINSLYPTEMKEGIYPDINTLRNNHINDTFYIMNYEGSAHVEIYEPKSNYPILPVKLSTGKVIFTYGTKIGVWNNHELRYAISKGCVIKKVFKNQYFKKSCKPFKEFVEDLYALRLKYKSESSSMEVIIKIILNSLYGKFAQKYLGKDVLIHKNAVTLEDLKHPYEQIGDFYRFTKDGEPSCFTIPIWASYVTSYGRIRLHKYLEESEALYCDTDSIITYKDIPTGTELGQMKLEMTIDYGIIVRPKFYAFVSDEIKYIKIKGLGKAMNFLSFEKILKREDYIKYNEDVKDIIEYEIKKGVVHFKKFTKFKESLRRHLLANEIILTHKGFDLNDTKREWGGQKFNIEQTQYSQPLNYNEMVTI